MSTPVTDAIAVIGMACRLPGAPTPDAFWELLRTGRDALTDPPPGRYANLPDGVTRGGFLDDVAGFDAGFFGIAPREANAMDPQQRLMLELAWEALEDARTVPAGLRATGTGVFVGAMADDYAQLTHARGPEALSAHTLPGVHRSVIAGRVSHVLGLGGPSLTVDTGQSSGLAAVHLACTALRHGEAPVALAGAVHLNLAPGSLLAARSFGALSPDGRCHTFDARADGYARGEGGVLVVLKPLARALADGDRVHCVVLGSAMNSDAGPDPLTVPGRAAQEDVLRRACRTAGVDPSRVQYVELHGTGTRVGDPVEAAALGAVLGAGRRASDPLLVGSAKTNVGHLEGAAGLVGLLKTALCIRHRLLAPSLNFTSPPPGIPLDALGLRVQTEPAAWPHPDEPPLAGVSSFGMGGTNCHVVMAGPPPAANEPPTPLPAATPVPFLLSARTAPALRAQARALLDHVRHHPDLPPPTIARTLATARNHHEHRAVLFAAAGQAPPSDALGALAEGRPDPGSVRGRVGAGDGLAVLFAGQGGRWSGAGQGLYTAFPVFADALDELCGHFDPYLELPLHEAMFATADSDLTLRTDYAQPALFALETALFRLLESWSVRPSVLAGHSVGELTAAHAAGVLSTADAAALVAARGRLMHHASGTGAMLAVQATEDEVRTALTALPGITDAVDIAAVNSPDSVVVSGTIEAVEQLTGHWAGLGRRTRRLRTGHAFHSPLMDQVLDDFRRVAAGLDYRAPRLPVLSNVTGEIATADQLRSPDYWTRHIRATVRFADGIRTLAASATGAYLELGPDPALIPQAARCLPPTDPTTGPLPPTLTATLRPGRPEPESLLTAVARLHTAGVPVDWSALLGPGPRTDLPTYAFRRAHHWLPEPSSPQAPVPSPQRLGAPEHPYWQRMLADTTARDRYRTALGLVRAEAAAVLGHPGPGAIDATRSFRDSGFDSATGVEFRDRLRELTGLSLPTTLVFDRPTPADLAEHLLTQLSYEAAELAHPSSPSPSSGRARDTDLIEQIGTATDDEIFALIDEFDA
ncbi:beta-ketoacyl synthase N-terminal-like domain-containing protein [Streptomyces sp. ADMS]|uniref:type I polyketide synthase n=1 Tax=Streptomyces sp. ADMS TaxID=3071415 RepID=UPI00296E3460|nr:beta-ketoacyl synthase N-terminal-like domain-containing protein [Streptomyces sp. ADMS]MDW4905895.1 beta-ketoacyl synthase N-terminal-like domain-containing protein [Streptomyces sp. ADMS]